MPDTLITVLGVALAVALAFWFLGGLIGFLRRTLFLVVGEDARHRRLLRAAPTIPIGKAADGEPVKIIGTIVLLDPPAASPLSGKSVAYAVVMIDQPASGTPVHRHVQRATFAVQDETGTVIVPAARPASASQRARRSSPGASTTRSRRRRCVRFSRKKGAPRRTTCACATRSRPSRRAACLRVRRPSIRGRRRRGGRLPERHGAKDRRGRPQRAGPRQRRAGGVGFVGGAWSLRPVHGRADPSRRRADEPPE